MMLVHGDVWEALCFNPNVVIAFFGMVAAPVCIILSVIKQKDYVTWGLKKFDFYFKKAYVYIPFILIEIAIWAHNFHCGI